MPKAEPHFDQDYADEISIKYQHIKIICNEARTVTEVFNEICICICISIAVESNSGIYNRGSVRFQKLVTFMDSCSEG